MLHPFKDVSVEETFKATVNGSWYWGCVPGELRGTGVENTGALTFIINDKESSPSKCFTYRLFLLIRPKLTAIFACEN